MASQINLEKFNCGDSIALSGLALTSILGMAGHKAAPQHSTTLTVPFEGTADLENAGNHDFEGPESANWHHSRLKRNYVADVGLHKNK